MRLIFSLFIFLATVMAPAQALPNSSGGICTVTTNVPKHGAVAMGQATSQLNVVAGVKPDQFQISLTGSFTGFVLYVTNAAGAKTGTLPPVAGSQACNGAATTVCHTASNTKRSMTWTWTAPTTAAASYKVQAMVSESGGVPQILTIQPFTFAVTPTPAPTQSPTLPPTPAPTPAVVIPPPPPAGTSTTAPVATARPVATPAPTTPPPAVVVASTGDAAPPSSNTPVSSTGAAAPPSGNDPSSSTGTTVQQAFNMVLVRLKAVLNGTGSVAALKSAIQTLMKQIQAAIQKAKAAKGMANANQPVNMIVTQPNPAPATAVQAAGPSTFMSFSMGFVDPNDAAIFAQTVTDASSPDSAVRAQSVLATSGDLASQLTSDPAGIDANGQVVVLPATQVAVYACPDGTLVSQDMMAVMCPAAPAAGPAIPLSNGVFIGIIVGGVVALMLVVGGIVYYQKSKSSTTVAPRV